ncbi:unnamed protein product [Chironomus riparius]|uniref:Uncharacterized protein n=1 Tax=Chironomus riparius TaxID=315576 RepID=A0A9N9RMA1_9DIPT|nr:unnamed protein product [Chironomus riparius]
MENADQVNFNKSKTSEVLHEEMEVKSAKRQRKCVSFDPNLVEKEERKSHPKTPLRESPQESNQMDKNTAKYSRIPMEY